jgi:hypothetical protein
MPVIYETGPISPVYRLFTVYVHHPLSQRVRNVPIRFLGLIPARCELARDETQNRLFAGEDFLPPVMKCGEFNAQNQ